MVFPREVPEFPADVALGVGDGPAPTSQPDVAAEETLASQ